MKHHRVWQVVLGNYLPLYTLHIYSERPPALWLDHLKVSSKNF
ncbi:unnamed protein product, partial [marine sediment metagenome]